MSVVNWEQLLLLKSKVMENSYALESDHNVAVGVTEYMCTPKPILSVKSMKSICSV